MCRHYSIIIASRPEVAFVTPTTPVDHSNIEWFCLRNIRSLDWRVFGLFWFVVFCSDLSVSPESSSEDMHTYTYELKDIELRTLISTYNILLDLRPRLPDSNFQMINLLCGDTTIGIYHRIFDSSSVRIPFSSFLLEVIKYYKVHISQLVPLGLNKVITFEILCRSLDIEPTVTLFQVFQTLFKQGDWFSFAKCRESVHVCMEDNRNPDSCAADDLPTTFDQSHVDRLSTHIIKLRTILEDVFALLRISKVREEAHALGTPFLGRVVDHTTEPAPTGIAIPPATLEEIVVTQPDHGVVTKAKNTTKRKASTRPKVSTNVTKKTKVGKKNPRVGSGDGSEQDDDDTFDDGVQSADIGSAADDFKHSDDIGQVSTATNIEPSKGLRRETRASSQVSHGANGDTHHRVEEDVHALDFGRDAPVSHVTEPTDTNFGVDETEQEEDGYIGYEGGDKDFPDGYYMPYPYEEGSNPKVCKTAIERFPTPAEIRQMETLSQEELTGRVSVLQCQLMSHMGELSARYDHVIRNVNRLSKRCAQQTLSFKQQSDDLRQQSGFTIRFKAERAAKEVIATEKEKVDEELIKAKSQLESQETKLKELKYQISQLESDTHLHNDIIASLEKQDKESRSDVTSFFQSDFESLVRRFLKSGEFNCAFRDVISLAMSSAESSLRVIAQLEPDPAVPFSKASSTTVSLGVRTRHRSSAPSTETFGHT
ncbi:hypothetical protein Tco_0585882, partial [Tanacetum coccineum]